MKKISLIILMMLMVQVLAMAQFSGGIGRGDYQAGFTPCTNPANGGEIEAAQSICSGGDPAALTNKTTPTGETGTLQYKWQISTTDATTASDFSDISLATAAAYDPPAGLTLTSWYRRLVKVTCSGEWKASNVVEVTVVAQPVAQSIIKSPNVTEVCTSGSVSATFTGGSGGVAPADEYQSSVDGGTSWLAYGSGTSLSSATAGIDRIQVRTRRTSSGTGCSNSEYTYAKWTVVAQPVAKTIVKSPNATYVCAGSAVSATFTGGSGGVSPADEYQSSVDGGVNWLAYTSGNPLSSLTGGTDRIQVRTRRTSSGTGCTSSGYTYAKWSVDVTPPLAVAKTGGSVTLNTAGSYTLLPGDVLSSWSDAGVGILSVTMVPPTVGCADLGTKNITVTVKDNCNNQTVVTSAITVTEGSALPPPWVSCVVGASGGTALYTPCTGPQRFTLSSKGYSSSTSDIIEFVNQPLSGSGYVIARVGNITGSGWAGLQMRETCPAGSKKVTFKTQLYKPAVRSEFRPVTNGQTTVREFICPNINWFKLERSGSVFKGYTSSNGQQWKLVFQLSNPMSGDLIAGIISEGYSFNTYTVAQFDHVSVGTITKETGADIPEFNTETARSLHVDLYPNPATAEVNISIPGNEEKVVLILASMEGKVLQTKEFTGSDTQLNTSSLQPGVYLVRIEVDGEVVVRRLVIL